MITAKITIPLVLKALYEQLGFYNMCNRSFDGFVRNRFAKTVEVPRNPVLTTQSTPGSRKKTDTDVDTKVLTFEHAFTGVQDEYEAQSSYDGVTLRAMIAQIAESQGEHFDAKAMLAAQASAVAAGGDNVQDWGAAELADDDLLKINEFFNKKKVSKKNRTVLVDVEVERSFKHTDIVNNAMSYNKELLEKGVGIIDNVTYIITANLELISGKPSLVGCYTPGIAFVLKKYMDRKEAYDFGSTGDDMIDYKSYFATDVLKDQYTMVLKKP